MALYTLYTLIGITHVRTLSSTNILSRENTTCLAARRRGARAYPYFGGRSSHHTQNTRASLAAAMTWRVVAKTQNTLATPHASSSLGLGSM